MVKEIRANRKVMDEIRRVSILGEDIDLTVDDSVEEAVIMLLENGQMFVGSQGNQKVIDFARYGYLRVLKDCPFKRGINKRCIAERCQLYVVRDGIGGCSLSWNFLPLTRL